MEYRAIYHSPFGDIELTSNGTALTALRFTKNGRAEGMCESIGDVRRWLDDYFAGHIPDFTLPVAPQGTPFQQRVWRELLNIAYGRTITYGDIARRVGCRSSQAVGQAVGRNPIALIIPCHRVIGSDGSLTGYAYGLDLKHQLIQLEEKNIHIT